MGSPLATIESVAGGRVDVLIDSPSDPGVMVSGLPMAANPDPSGDGEGLFGLSGPDRFYISLQGRVGAEGGFTPLGRIIAGAHVFGDLEAGDRIRSVRILRSGEAAQAFRTDTEAFRRLQGGR